MPGCNSQTPPRGMSISTLVPSGNWRRCNSIRPCGTASWMTCWSSRMTSTAVSFERSIVCAPIRISTRDFGSVQNDPPVATGKLTEAADHSVPPLAWKASLPSTKLTRPTRVGGPSSASAGQFEPRTAAITTRARMLTARRRIGDLKSLTTKTHAWRRRGAICPDKHWRGRRFPLCASTRRNKAAADQLAMDLVGALPDLGDLGVAEQPLDPVILDVAIAAMELHRLGGDAHREIGGAHFQHRGFDGDVGGAAVDEAGDMPEPRLAHRQIGRHVRQEELDALEFNDAPARLAPLVDVADGVLEGGAGDAEGVRGNARPRLVERRQQQLQPIARTPEQIVAPDAAFLKGERRGRGGAMPQLIFLAQHGEARGALLDDQRGDRLA